MKISHSHSLLAILGFASGTQAVIETTYGQYVDRCPGECSQLSLNPATWTHFHRVDSLARCDQPLLFDLNVQNLVSDPETVVTIRACSQMSDGNNGKRDESVPLLTVDNDCGATEEPTQRTLRSTADAANANSDSADVSLAVDQLLSYLHDASSCGTTIQFAKAGEAVVGLYSGAEVVAASAVDLLERFREQSQSGTHLLEVCDPEAASHAFGVVAGGVAELDKVQDAVKSWNNAQCVDTGPSETVTEEQVEVGLLVSSIEPSDGNTQRRSLSARAECRDIQVESGDSCASLATRCGISGNEFMEYNPKEDLCSTLMPGQYVCCSPGELPDHSPQPGPDGTCYTYTVKKGDGCWAIANSFGIDQSVITENNKNTWGWAGCDRLQPGQVICLSPGDLPFPNPIENAECGPQVPGTTKPTDGTPYAELNPCALNSCCDVWGFCGVTAEFCTPTPADTGAPGTAQPGTNGCISNCGTDIVNNDKPPATFHRVGYFEAWNGERLCLNMDITQVDTKELTHIHFAFATVTEDFKISVADIQEQFDKFRDMDTDVKKILSFGGWAFSTNPDTFQRFRDATKPEHREAFAANCVAFMKDNSLDGLDFDWEYPGAPDIPGIPPGSEEEANNYLEFLKIVRDQVKDSAQLAIALPASFWYLKPYPVDEIEGVVDYFIFMTYDYHGQWDVGNEFAVPGCPDGNCLRSHVNLTETFTSLSMITKAGVHANKVLVGITSYGRSFRMSDSNCRDPMCTYTDTANSSEAYPGRCTETRGYISNAELKEIINGEGDHPLIDSYRDEASLSDILIYGMEEKADWVGYMNTETRDLRLEQYKVLNFGGATDWAVDLMEFVDDNDDDDDDDDPDGSCNPEDGTYSDEEMPEGSYMPWYLMDPKHSAASGKRYITIVNLTPHRFVLTSTHSYQMDVFDFGDIPQGRGRQNTAVYGGDVGSSPVDTNGEAYYSIEGTDKKFTIRKTTHIPDTYPQRTVFDLTGMGLGQREYMDPEQETSVTLVITGSEDYGFITSLRHGPGGWMQEMYDVIKDRKIKSIVMPGTHDSGMSEISDHLITAANKANTQTQGINLYNQLRAGARWFDLRIATIHQTTPNEEDYGFWVTHVNDPLAEVALGNTGEGITAVIDEINQFTRENPGEVMFFRIKYLVGIRKVPSLGPIYWTDEIVKDFFTQLKKINNRCGDLDTSTPFQNQTVSYFADLNDGAGCVIFLLNGHLQEDVPQSSNVDGIYHHRVMDYDDYWSDMGEPEDMAADQIEHWSSVARPQAEDKGKVWISQWLISPSLSSLNRYGIQNLAILATNPALYWEGLNGMSPTSWPNVLLVDYIGVVVKDHTDWDSLSAELYTLAIGMNLYMISQNCGVNPDRLPLLPPLSSGGAMPANALAAPWQDIIFGNGTVLNKPPPAFHPGRVEILKNGTVFGNGTMLPVDVPNPDFHSTSI